MVRPGRHLRVLLALLLVWQWGSAFAQCLAPLGLAPAGAHAVEICGVDGPRTILLGEDGQPAAPAAVHDSCPICPGGAAPAAAPPGVPAAPVRYAALVPPPVAGM
ncbi:hypothetical protein, partial [Paracraurococcus ruber]